MKRNIELKDQNLHVDDQEVIRATKIENTMFFEVKDGSKIPVTFKNHYLPNPLPHHANERTCDLSSREAYELVISNENDND